ncbi:MAG: DUF11 domain-containing protein [Verrucomicrobia bacterium]|nr:DUF11 domain-containing protein [Verrucomicrobiota bacterium]
MGSVLVTVTRTGLLSESATVGYFTSDGTATAGVDYVPRSGLLTFSPGVNVLTFTVPIIDDSLIEPRETVNLSLFAVTSNASLSVTSAVVAIVENDFRAGQLTFSATNYAVLEDAGVFEFSVIRTNGSTGVLTVDYETVNGTALGTNDFVTQSGTLTFVEGQTNQLITLTLLDDLLVEGTETFSIRLKNPSFGTVISGTTNAQVNLLDDDVSVVIAAGSTLVSESLNSNGIIDPGETVSLSLAVRNIGSGNTPSLTATLLPAAGIGSPSGPQSYGVLVANGPSEARTFSFTSTGATGDRLQVTLQMSDGSAATFAYTVGGQASRTFSNTNRIVINDDAPASTYPSGIDVANLGGTVTSLTVTLTNFTHDWPNDVDVLLVGPGGQRVMLMSDAGTNLPVSGLNLTFSDSATTAIPLLTRLQTRTYSPANYAAPGLNTADRFAAPAPQPIALTDPFPYTNISLAVFNGTSPNGTWLLYVMDDTSGQAGSIGGWSLNFQTSDPVTPAAGVSVSDLAVSASAASSSSVVGGHVTTTLTITNKGPALANNVALIEQLAPGLSLVSATPSVGTWAKVQNTLTWTVGSLPNGGTASITVVTRPQSVGVMSSAVSVAANQTDLNTGNNSLVLTTTVGGVPTLAVLRSGNSVSLSWLASSGFKLQVSDSLTSANWTDVGTVPQVVGGQNVVSMVAAGNKFYRLRAP